jgi:uncharacterized protein
MGIDAAILRILEREARDILSRNPACHDWDHTTRVLNNARHIRRREPAADPDVVDVAALFHDVGRQAELADEGTTCHAERGAAMIGDILRRAGVRDDAFIAHVAACIRTHRYRRRTDETPATIEAKIIFDADKLDSLGAIGIGRAFHFAGRIGARVHNRAEEALAGRNYGREDSAYREFLVKLRHIPARLLTAEGRRLAAARHAFMEAFFARLDREVRGDDFDDESPRGPLTHELGLG